MNLCTCERQVDLQLRDSKKKQDCLPNCQKKPFYFQCSELPFFPLQIKSLHTHNSLRSKLAATAILLAQAEWGCCVLLELCILTSATLRCWLGKSGSGRPHILKVVEVKKHFQSNLTADGCDFQIS